MLHCFRCGDVLEEGPPLRCVAGDLPLSPYLERVLRERFGAGRPDAPSGPRPGFKVGGLWFCPRCGIPMAGAEEMTCGSCGGTLADLAHHLVELHPHR